MCDGHRMLKFDFKGWKRGPDWKPGANGQWVGIGEGDENWPEILKALDEIGYHGWGIAEQGGGDSPEGLKDLSQRMSRVFAS